jgi:hypothetical protein
LATKTLDGESTETKARAEANIKKEERAKDGAKAMMEYLANSREVRERMAKLRELRLAQEKADMVKAETTKAEIKKVQAKKAEAKTAVAKTAVTKKPGKKAVNG